MKDGKSHPQIEFKVVEEFVKRLKRVGSNEEIPFEEGFDLVIDFGKCVL